MGKIIYFLSAYGFLLLPCGNFVITQHGLTLKFSHWSTDLRFSVQDKAASDHPHYLMQHNTLICAYTFLSGSQWLIIGNPCCFKSIISSLDSSDSYIGFPDIVLIPFSLSFIWCWHFLIHLLSTLKIDLKKDGMDGCCTEAEVAATGSHEKGIGGEYIAGL